MRDTLEELLKAYSIFKELEILILKYERKYNRETKSVLDRLLIHANGMFNSFSKFVKGESYNPETYDILHEAILNDIKWLNTTEMSQEDISIIASKTREFTRIAVPISSSLGTEEQDKTK